MTNAQLPKLDQTAAADTAAPTILPQSAGACCGGKHSHEHAHEHAPAATPAQADGTAAVHLDPVCGMTVKVNPARMVEHAAHTYYFCSDSCHHKFAADPEKYLKKVAPAARTTAASCCGGSHADNAGSPAPLRVPLAAQRKMIPIQASAQPMVMESVAESPYTDPVCGMKVAANPARMHLHAGQNYYFCCTSCQQKFALDPAKYLQPKPAAPPPTAADLEAVYICPMCEGVEQIGPGDCWKCGMALEPRDGAAAGDDSQLRDMQRRFWIAASFSLPLFLLAMSDLWPAAHRVLLSQLGSNTMQWLQALLATPVVLWAAAPLNHRAWRSYVTGHLNMFSLIGLGTASAYLFSLFALLLPQALPAAFLMHGMPPLYFEASAVIVTLVLLGQVLEMRAHGKTNQAMLALLALAPTMALRLNAKGEEEEIPLAEVVQGDILRVKPGARVAVDGEIREGQGVLDESMLSGEAMPISKTVGEKVLAGTVNQQGSFTMQALQVGKGTMLSSIVEMVQQAARSRAPVQALVDKVAAWFVPAVVLIALISFALWASFGPPPAMAHGLMAAVAVLIIACPCALGLATPMSIMVAIGRGAQHGVLVKEAQALQAMAEVDTLIIDKTGTLTMGRPSLQQILSTGVENDLLQVAASLEAWSEHPLAQALLLAARERKLALHKVEDFQQVAGSGVSGVINGQRWFVGNAQFIAQQGIAVESWQTEIEAWRATGSGVIFLASKSSLQAVFQVADQLKPNARASLQQLQAAGLKVVLASGDHPASVQAVAQQLGIKEVHAQMLPQDKLQLVQQLQAQGRKVAMAGDGVNDAPALARAEVGIAMGNGTEVAMQSAHLVLLKGDLQGLVRSRVLAKACMANIGQNLWFAFVYNVLGVALAAGVLYPSLGILASPMLASAAMSFSSLSVIANALRLRRLAL